MRQVAAIRTHRWGDEEDRLMQTLAPVFGEDLVVVFQNRRRSLRLPLQSVDATTAWAVSSGLRAVPDWGWRCGDYFYYALRQAKPDFDYYWLIEPDVVFIGETADFFRRFDGATEDALGKGYRRYEEDIPFTRGLPGVDHYKAIYPLTRMSGRAIDMLRARRIAYGQGQVGNRFFSNDEIFTFSNVSAEPGYHAAALEQFAPDWFAGASFDTNPTVLLEALLADPPVNKVLHPVRSRYEFKRAIAARLASNTGFLRRMRYSLTHLSDEDFNEILSDATDELRRSLLEHRQIGAQSTQRQQDWAEVTGAIDVVG